MLQSGWRSFWSEPEISGQGNAIGGACIFVRRHLAAWSSPVNGASVMPRHLAHCFLRTSDLGTIGLYSVYPRDSVKVTGVNVQFLGKLGERIQ
eukprot:7063454-Pyramimonas_sp.AAC.1